MKRRTRILIDARDLIADPTLWGQGSMESDHDPPKRCISGAICAAAGIDETEIQSNPVTADVIALVRSVIESRYDGEKKLRAFMTLEDIEHCPPTNNDWLVGFNDYSRHDEVLSVLDEAIAQSEPCQECETELTAETFHLLTIDDNPEQILCGHCAMLAQYPEGDPP
ncbi:MAG: hypothetical protein F4Z01_06840 [Gammaproteobacteria bacterium]|nr:hypothetical protein [Gammaproteobacteria bacterium]